MLEAILTLILVVFGTPSAEPRIGSCTPVGEKNPAWPKELRVETRDRIWLACKATNASDRYCKFWLAVGLRESSYRAGVRHTLGKNEHGLGALGLSLRWHRDKWPGRDEDPAWCTPENSFAVGHAIAWRALTRYRAETPVDVQAIYAGRWTCWTAPDSGRRMCRPNPSAATYRSICGRMRRLGESCHARWTREDFGDPIPRNKRRSWAEAQIARWVVRSAKRAL